MWSQVVSSCDRACLIGIADSYFAALAAHDLSKAPLAPKVRLAQKSDSTTLPSIPVPVSNVNVAVTQLNLREDEDVLRTMTEGPATFKIYVPDPVSQEIGGIVMIKLENRAVEAGFHLKVDNRRIIEAEFVFVHIDDAAALENLRTPRLELLAAIPSDRRMPHDRLRSLAYSTYDSRAQGIRAVPLAENCSRRDNGSPASSCGPQLTTADLGFIDGSSLHRVRLADPETSLVFSLVFNYAALSPFAAAHIHKVQEDRVVSTEAVGFGPRRGSLKAGPGQLPLRDWTAFTR
jgi:hypothetical protein